MAETFYHLADYKQTGLMHVEKGKECEDAVRVIYSPKAQAAVAALSDGAGSYKHAAEGARLSRSAPTPTLENNFSHRNPQRTSTTLLRRLFPLLTNTTVSL